MTQNKTRLMQSDEIEKVINDLSNKIYQDLDDIKRCAIVGIQTRGVELGRRIRENLEELSGEPVKSGTMDITFYRDDLATRGVLPVLKETKIDFNITNMDVIMVDDVIFTGRTTKAALETLTAFGRPRSIRLFVLVDRGNREMPIQPDYCGFAVKTRIDDIIKVRLQEIDNEEDGVFLCKPGSDECQ